jgi:hypothetical protein
MSQATHSHGSDKGAAFAGLIGGAIFIAIVVVALVFWTNSLFDAHEAEGTHASVSHSAATA